MQDYTESDRIYIPQDELAQAGLIDSDLVKPDTKKLAPLIRSLYQRTEDLMKQGAPLGAGLTGRMGWEVRAMTLGGIATLHQLKQQADDDLLTRPRLSKWVLIKVMVRSSNRVCYEKTVGKWLK